MSRYEPKLSTLSIRTRDPIVAQDVIWEYGPQISDKASLSVIATGHMIEIRERGSAALDMPIERARMLHEALGNVIEAVDQLTSGGEQA